MLYAYSLYVHMRVPTIKKKKRSDLHLAFDNSMVEIVIRRLCQMVSCTLIAVYCCYCYGTARNVHFGSVTTYRDTDFHEMIDECKINVIRTLSIVCYPSIGHRQSKQLAVYFRIQMWPVTRLFSFWGGPDGCQTRHETPSSERDFTTFASSALH